MGSDSKDSGSDWGQEAYTNAYNAAASGQDWDTVSGNTDPNYLDYAQAGYEAGSSSGSSSSSDYDWSSMFDFDWSSGTDDEEEVDPINDTGTSYDDIVELLGEIDTEDEANADMMYGYVDGEWQIVDRTDLPDDFQYGYSTSGNDWASGINDLNDMYGSYLDAASAATDYVNTEISEEQANAALFGIDYNITDEQKSDRINAYFATIWSESDQTSLENAVSEWGEPTGFQGWTVTRGDATLYQSTPGSEQTVSTSTGTKPIIDSEDEGDVLGGSTSVLG